MTSHMVCMQTLMFQLELLDGTWSHISQNKNIICFQLIQYQSDFAEVCFICSFSYLNCFAVCLFWFPIFTLFNKNKQKTPNKTKMCWSIDQYWTFNSKRPSLLHVPAPVTDDKGTRMEVTGAPCIIWWLCSVSGPSVVTSLMKFSGSAVFTCTHKALQNTLFLMPGRCR